MWNWKRWGLWINLLLLPLYLNMIIVFFPPPPLTPLHLFRFFFFFFFFFFFLIVCVCVCVCFGFWIFVYLCLSNCLPICVCLSIELYLYVLFFFSLSLSLSQVFMRSLNLVGNTFANLWYSTWLYSFQNFFLYYLQFSSPFFSSSLPLPFLFSSISPLHSIPPFLLLFASFSMSFPSYPDTCYAILW